MAMSGRQRIRKIFGDSLTVHQGISDALSGLYPLYPESGIINRTTGRKLHGIRWGWCGDGRSGGVHGWDPRVCYLEDTGATDLNAMFVGRIGRGKSAGLKKFIFRAVPWGNKFIVMDVGGEYSPVVVRLNKILPGLAKELKFGPDSQFHINPLDPALLMDDGDVEFQLELISSMALSYMGKDRLTMGERAALEWAVKDLHQGKGEPLLEGLVAKLMQPTQYMLDNLGRDKEYEFVRDLVWDMALALKKIAGLSMFNKPTSPGLYEDTSLLVFNLKGLKDMQLRLVVRVLNFLNETRYGANYNYNVHDETWRLVSDPEYLKGMIYRNKTGRREDMGNIYIFHHLNSLILAGFEELVRELAADCSTVVSYTQKEVEIEAAAKIFGFNEAAARRIPKLPKYHSMWKVGELAPIQVEDVDWPGDAEMHDTSWKLRGHTEEWFEKEIDRQVDEALELLRAA